MLTNKNTDATASKPAAGAAPPAGLLGRAALAYAAGGWFVFPLRPDSKEPLYTGGVNGASRDPAQVRAWWAAEPRANIGIALHASGLGVIDVDHKPDKGVDGRPLFASLGVLLGSLGDVHQATGSGGQHWVFRRVEGQPAADVAHWPAERRVNKKTGVDLFTAGHRYIVAAPSTVGGRAYRWQGTARPWADVRALPAAWAAEVATGARPAVDARGRAADASGGPAGEVDRDGALLDLASRRVAGATLDELASQLRVLSPEMPRDEWLRVLWGCAAQWQGTPDEAAAIDALEAWSARTTREGQYKPGEVAKRWAEHTSADGGRTGGGVVTFRSVRSMARSAGWLPLMLGGIGPDTWKNFIQTRKEEDGAGGFNTVIIPNAWNAALFLAHDPALAGCVRRNVLSDAIEMHSHIVCPLRDATRLPTVYNQAADWVGATQCLVRRVHGPLSKEAMNAAITAAADVHAYDPMRRYVEGLTWDGTPRLDGWLHRVTGCDDTPLHRAIGRKWMVGLASRATTEWDGRGTKMDSVLVLQGKEGIGKSTVGSIIGGDWYASFSASLDGDDIYYVIEKTMVLEFDELDSMGKAEATRVKSLVSTQADTFRRKYAASASDKPRRCVFLGTTNDAQFLTRDLTVRRWWVVPCGVQKFQLGWLRDNRDQLIAEAYHAFQAGELPVLPEALHQAQQDSVAGVLLQHPYDEAIAAWTVRVVDAGAEEAGKGWTLGEAVEGALTRPAQSLNMGDMRRFGDALRGAGWSKAHAKNGKRWVPPGKRSADYKRCCETCGKAESV